SFSIWEPPRKRRCRRAGGKPDGTSHGNAILYHDAQNPVSRSVIACLRDFVTLAAARVSCAPSHAGWKRGPDNRSSFTRRTVQRYRRMAGDMRTTAPGDREDRNHRLRYVGQTLVPGRNRAGQRPGKANGTVFGSGPEARDPDYSRAIRDDAVLSGCAAAQA